MKRSQLKNKPNKTGSKKHLKLYKIQRNIVTEVNKSLKKGYFKEKLQNGKNVKYFWKIYAMMNQLFWWKMANF